MFFILSKILSFLLSPFNWCVLLLLMQWLIKSKKYKKVLLTSSVSIFIIFSNTFIFQKVISVWETPIESYSMLQNNNSPIVVLGGLSSYDDTNDRIHFNEAADRLFQALPVHINNPNRKLILSGGSAEIYFEERPEADYLKDYLITIGINPNDILFEKSSRNTHENAYQTALLFDSLNLDKDIILITSAFHMKRAQACFKKQGFNVIAYSAHAYTNHQSLKPTDYFMPSLNTLQLWPILIKEWFGILAYQMKGYV